MNIKIVDGLPFIDVQLTIKQNSFIVSDVLLDTGSASSIFSIDFLVGFGIHPEPQDKLKRMVGIGGHEFVFERKIKEIKLDQLFMSGATIQIGKMDYGFIINGILGSDFLHQTRAVIDFSRLEIN